MGISGIHARGSAAVSARVHSDRALLTRRTDLPDGRSKQLGNLTKADLDRIRDHIQQRKIDCQCSVYGPIGERLH